MRLTSANQAIIPLSMRSVFSRKPIASAKRRTARGLTIAVARPAPHSMAKASRSYPPVASSATKPTWCSWQNAINSVIPALLLVKRRIAPSRPSRTSSAAEQTSTPQIRSVTVTCLVHAIDNRATVRSCVTLQQAVPRLTSGCCQRGNGRRTPRTGSGGHLTPCSAAPITLRRRLLDTRGSVHKRGYGHKQATAAPIVAGVSEAGDCSGKPGAGCVGVAGSAALRRERQSGLCLAATLPGRCGGTGRASLAAGDGDAGLSEGDGTGRRERGDRDRVGRRLSPAGWRGCPGHDAAAGAGRSGAAMIPVPSGVRVWLAVGRTGGRPDRHAQRYERAGVAGAARPRPRPA